MLIPKKVIKVRNVADAGASMLHPNVSSHMPSLVFFTNENPGDRPVGQEDQQEQVGQASTHDFPVDFPKGMPLV